MDAKIINPIEKILNKYKKTGKLKVISQKDSNKTDDYINQRMKAFRRNKKSRTEVGICHNIHYDCGGDTFEEAIINLANIVYEYNKKNEKENK